jgi:hypothetical protein
MIKLGVTTDDEARSYTKDDEAKAIQQMMKLGSTTDDKARGCNR